MHPEPLRWLFSIIDRIKSLNILHNNSRSILRDGRLDEYNILLDYLHNPFQILAFTETWLKPNNVDLVKFDGYNGSHIIRPVDEHFDLKEHGGGISIFIKDDLCYKVREDLNLVLPYIETLFIELSFGDKLYVIGVIYRVPNTNINSFNETLNGIIEPLKITMNNSGRRF